MADDQPFGPVPGGEQSDVLSRLNEPAEDLAASAINKRASDMTKFAGEVILPDVNPHEQLERDRQVELNAASAHQEAEEDYREMMETAEELPVGEQDRPSIEVVSHNPEPGPEAVGNALSAGDNAADMLTDTMESDIIDYVKMYFDMSHEKISERYDHWHEAEIAHDVYVPAYVADRSKSKSKQNRPKIVDVIKVPFSRAISDTICTYNLSIFGGNKPFIIEALGRQANRRGAKIIQAELSAAARRNAWESKVYQMTMDQNRYGMAPMANYWGEGGNRIINLDPWGSFPDPRVTAQNREEAEFFGYRSWSSLSALYRRGIYSQKQLAKLEKSRAGVSWACNDDTRETVRGQSVDWVRDQSRADNDKWGRASASVLNTLFVFCHPNWLGIPGAKFGLYRIVVADEKHIILFDRSPYPHGKIPMVMGDGHYDAHKTFMSGTYDLMMPLQRFQDWLLRTRVENVQTIVQSRLVVDPARINIKDILQPNAARLVRTLPGADPKGALFPVEVNDATQRYWNDIAATGDLMERVSSANDTAQGVSGETTRTATEVSNVTQLGQQRLGTQARLTSAQTMRPLARMQIENIQYFNTNGGSVLLPPEVMGDANGDGWIDWEPRQVIGEFEYQIVDGTLPLSSDAQTANLVRAIRALSETGMSAEWDMGRFVEAMIESMGFDNVEEWKIDPEKAKARVAAMAQHSTPDTQVVPNEVLMKQAEQGNVVPMREAFPQANP